MNTMRLRVSREAMKQVALQLQFCMRPPVEVADELASRGLLRKVGDAFTWTERGRDVYARAIRGERR